MDHNVYSSPLTGRYASKEMSYLWSPQFKHSTWRKLWLALATEEKALGLAITDQQIEQMAAHLEDIDFAAVEAKEKELRHDVMSHIHVFGTQCPDAMPVIHLGATSCYVTDNSELIQMKNGLKLIQAKLLKLMDQMRKFCRTYADMPTLGFTHYQVAQLTTVGKRFSLYLQDFLMDYEQLNFQLENLPFRSVKGTTGTQASFLALFDGDHEKVKELERRVAKRMGFDKIVAVSGQTYTRKVDYFVVAALAGLAGSAAKMANDIRLLANLREMEEPFGKKQIGSSAMAYKRNPMRCERVCSLARYLMTLPNNPINTHAVQWFERTLDDSANRRLVLPEAFMTADVILSILLDVTNGLQVWPNVIARHVREELPFMATENILMAAVRAGGDRQALHEVIRVHSMDAAKKIKEEGGANDLLERLAADPAFASIRDRFDELVNPRDFIGRAPEQTEEFIANCVDPVLEAHAAEWQDVQADALNV